MTLLSLPQVAERLGVSRATAYRLVAAGEFDVVQVRGAKRIPDSSVEAFVKRNSTPAAYGPRLVRTGT